MQHLRVGTVNYFCSGAASQTRPTAHDERTIFSLGLTSGFLAVTLSAETLRARFITETGREVYSVDLPRVRPVAAASTH